MHNLEKYKTDLKALVDKGQKMLDDLRTKKDQASIFYSGYQNWYSEAYETIKQLLPSRLGEFEEVYSGEKRKEITASTYCLKDWLLGVRSAVNTFTGEKYYDDASVAFMRFQHQLAILVSAGKRFESSLFDIKQIVRADLFDSELDAAESLNSNGFQRGAGAIAGVVIEGHLLQVCENHKIKITKKNPSINDLALLLKNGNVIDVPEWRKIQHLADLRNLCDHKKKTAPTTEQIEELIEGSRKLTKNLF